MKATLCITVLALLVTLAERTLKFSTKTLPSNSKVITAYPKDKFSTALFTDFNQYLSKRLLES